VVKPGGSFSSEKIDKNDETDETSDETSLECDQQENEKEKEKEKSKKETLSEPEKEAEKVQEKKGNSVSVKLEPLVGQRIQVYWPDRRKWFTGVILGLSNPKDGGTHDVKYDNQAVLGTEPISEKLFGESPEKWVKCK